MSVIRVHRAVGVRVGSGPAAVQVGGGAPVVVQSMTSTDTTDAAATAAQCIALAEAGSEMVRITVNIPEAAAAARRKESSSQRRNTWMPPGTGAATLRPDGE